MNDKTTAAGSDRPRWDARFDREDYLFGTEPAAFVAREAKRLPAGARVLALADGEGRNSVHLARLGHRVLAMDASPVGLAKARRLAAAADLAPDVRPEFVQADIASWDWRPDAFDAVLAVFIQFAGPDLRDAIFRGMARSVRPGGLILLHGYAPRQIGYGTGGPGAVENLYTLPMLHAAFPGWEVLTARDHDADLAEGTGHAGKSALIDFVARRPGVAGGLRLR